MEKKIELLDAVALVEDLPAATQSKAGRGGNSR